LAEYDLSKIEVGKGFAIVAEEIRKLSEETAELTEDIVNIVNEIEGSAYKAQKLVDNVDASVVKEEEKIHDTINRFIEVSSDIKNLSEDISYILDSTKDVIMYNGMVKDHVEDLAFEIEEVTGLIEDAIKINNDNKNKTNNTKKVINELEMIVGEMIN
jgi:methyl-accepting chemotaxis protein